MTEKPARILYGVQDTTGRAVAEAVDARLLSAHREESRVQLRYGQEVVSEGYAPPEEELTVHTWDADADTSGKPLTSRPVKP
jgi:hypothetical protein